MDGGRWWWRLHWNIWGGWACVLREESRAACLGRERREVLAGAASALASALALASASAGLQGLCVQVEEWQGACSAPQRRELTWGCGGCQW